MKVQTRYMVLLITILTVFALSAFWTFPVFADDAPPPPAETGEVVLPPETDSPPPPEAVDLVSPPEEGAPSEDESTADVLAQLPDDTEIVVLDSDGEVLPLASQEAADAIAFIDPVWCPVGVSPKTNGTSGCTTAYGSLKELIDNLMAGTAGVVPGTAGIIWIQSGADSSGGSILLDGLDVDLGNWENFSLTLQGGWSGLSGSTAIVGVSTFTQSLSIINWNGDITLKDIVVSGVSLGSVTNNAALDIQTTKKITLTNVQVNGNTGPGTVHGAWLDNDDGAVVSDVVITNSSFDGNKNYGLIVYSDGTITLSNVKANGNGATGARLDNTAAASAKNVTLISGVYEFNGNLGWGLVVYSNGAITLKDITANSNDQTGAYLVNTSASTAQPVTLTGTNIFSENLGSGLFVQSNGAIKTNNLIANANGAYEAVYLDNNGAATAQPVILTGTNEFKFNAEGLRVFSKGAITLNNVTASYNNSGDGVYLNNTDSGHLTPQNVTLTGYGNFDNNLFDGIDVRTYGAIALANIHANNNGGFGANLNNYGDGTLAFADGYATLPRPVTLSVSGGNTDTDFINNYSGGLIVNSIGAITISGLDAQGSINGNGAILKNDYPGAVGGITFTGWGAFAGNNSGYGLRVSSFGTIKATGLWAWGNASYGALLDNSAGTGGVTITGNTSYGNNNSYGLQILSKGAITLGAIYTDNNNGTGVYIDNSFGTQNVTLNGAYHDFNNNTGSGLEIYSKGAITITNLYAYNNSGFGALLDNCIQAPLGTCTVTTVKAVTLNGSNNTFEWNGNTGLDITSKGIITTNNVSARDNGGFGAYFDNQMAGAVGTINVKNSPTYWAEFARNGLDGLKLHSNGTITVMDLDAYENGQAGDPDWGFGVYLNNASGGGSGNIILGTSRPNWRNGLSGNFLSGLEVYSNGTVTLSNIGANGNGGDNGIDTPYGYGASIYNADASLPKAVVLLGSNRFNDNASGGLYISSDGTITLNNIDASGNGHLAAGGDGVQLWNPDAATPQPVTLKGNNTFFGNYNNGLQVISKGAITVNNIVSNYNGDGAELYNTAGGPGSPQNVTLTGFGEFIGNYNNGLEILSYGAITLNNITANENGHPSGANGFGAYLDNYQGNAITPKPVTLNGSNNFWGNLDGGLEIHSLGAIKLNSTSADDNGFGILLDNNESGALGGVSITGGVWTSGNDMYGMNVTTKGAITINVIDAWAGLNGSYGWNLDNHFDGAVGGITLTSPNPDWAFDFWNNGSYGLWMQSLGAIKVTGLDSSDNGWDTGGWGALLDNAFPGSVGTITITITSGRNDFNGNSGDGLILFSNRAITITNLVAVSNSGIGALLDNTYSGSGSPQNVTVSGSGEFNGNGDSGLAVLTYGLITLNNISANDNGQNNFYNEAHSLPVDPNTGWGAYLDNHTGVTPKGITLNGSNNFNGNYQDGLWATSLGPIKVNAVTARWNRGNGAYLDNQWSTAVGGVTITSAPATNWNNFDGNGSLGLNVYSGGLITLSNIRASGNFGGGARIETYNDFGPANVIMGGVNNFIGNGDMLGGTGSGLAVYATGTITLNNVTASGNALNGAILDNWYAGFYYGPVPPLTINLTGVNTFSGNGGDGLYFTTYGNVSLNKITADNNGGSGVWGETYGMVPGNITLTCGSTTRNNGYGWHLNTLGVITLKGVFGFGNDSGTYTNVAPIVIRACPLP
jgi:hypothetical protein